MDGGAQEALAVEPGEQVIRAREEEGEAEGKVVGRVARVGEQVAGDLELAVADGDEDALLVELRDELGDLIRKKASVFWIFFFSCFRKGLAWTKYREKTRTSVELRIGKQAHKVLPVPRRDVISLQMQRNVAKRLRVAVEV